MKMKPELVALSFAVALALGSAASRLSGVDHHVPTASAATDSDGADLAQGLPSPAQPGDDAAAAKLPPQAADMASAPMSPVALARLDEAARSDDWHAIDGASAAAIASAVPR